MYLQLGQDTVIRTDNIIGIFDLDNTTVQKGTRDFLNAAEKNGETVLEEILNDVNAFAAGEPQFDDITMILLSIQSKEGKTDETEIAKERDGADGPSIR